MGLLDGKLKGATALIPKFGTTAYLRWFDDDGEYDTATLAKDQPEKFGSPHTGTVVWWAPTPRDLRADGIVKPTDRLALVDGTGLPYDPAEGMKVEFPLSDASLPRLSYRVIRAQPLTTGGAVAAWQLLLRK